MGGEIKKTAIVRLKCLVCGTQAEMKVPVKSFGQLFYIEVPPRYCGKCFVELEQIINNRGSNETNSIDSK